MNYSKQREQIRNIVIANPVHMTAEEVFRKVKETYPRVSLATVYRNLNQLSEHGMIRKISMPSGGDRFDGRVSPHEHMVCEKCGAIFDIEMECIGNIDREAMEKQGFAVQSKEIILRGVCADCRNTQSMEKEK